VTPAGRTKIDDFDSGALGVPKEDILGLEVAMDDVHVGPCEELEGLQDLLREFSEEGEGDAGELGVLEEVIQII